jgi:hypothetical protein
LEIISHYLKSKKVVDGMDAEIIARIMDGRSCAELETVINEAGLYAGYERSDFITMDHLLEACLRIIYHVPAIADKENGKDFDPTEPIWLLQQLWNMGVELVNITMGNPYFNPHINRPYTVGSYEAPEAPLIGIERMLQGTAQLKQAVPDMKILCSAMTFLGTQAPNVAAAFIEKGGFDLAGFGRTIFAYPDFAKDILTKGRMEADKICICCSKCTEIMRAPGGTPGCVIHDRDVYLPLHKSLCGGAKK